MWGAGLLSGLLGIGSGAFKVLALDYVMQLPMKVSTATSNFMIGITAAASAAVYFGRGDIHPVIATPVALGVMLGASVGTPLMSRLRNITERGLFLPVILISHVDDRARAGAGRIVSRVEGFFACALVGSVAGIVLMLIGLVSTRSRSNRTDSFDVTPGRRNRHAGRPPGVFTSVPQVLDGLRRWPVDPPAVAAVGLLALLATPVAAVVVAFPLFLSDGDRRYAIISAILAAALIGSLLIGGGG